YVPGRGSRVVGSGIARHVAAAANMGAPVSVGVVDGRRATGEEVAGRQAPRLDVAAPLACGAVPPHLPGSAACRAKARKAPRLRIKKGWARELARALKERRAMAFASRWMMIAVFLLTGATAALAQNADRPVKDFFGTYVGRSISSADEGLSERDLSVTIRRYKDDGFTVDWTTAFRRKDGEWSR